MSVALARKPDERAALRAAVSAAATVKAELVKRQAGLEAASEHATRAGERARLASAAVGKAKEEHTARVTRALEEGREPPRSTTVQYARDMEVEALDELSVAKAAIEQITADVADLQTDVRVAGRAVDRALAEMLVPLARHLIDEVNERHERFLHVQAALSAVGALCGDSWSAIRKEIDLSGLRTDALDRRVDMTSAKWRLALNAVREDSAAELPSINDAPLGT
jgi:hypothetical protein